MGVDLLIHDALVLTVDERNRLYERGTVLVTDGCIEDVRTSRGENSEIDASTIIDGNGKLVMPGLVNAHTHLEMTPLIGGFSELNLTEMLGSGTALSNRLGNGDFEYLVEAGVAPTAARSARSRCTGARRSARRRPRRAGLAGHVFSFTFNRSSSTSVRRTRSGAVARRGPGPLRRGTRSVPTAAWYTTSRRAGRSSP